MIELMPVPAGEPKPGTCLVAWNSHGDAVGLWRIKAEVARRGQHVQLRDVGTATIDSSHLSSANGSAPSGDLRFRCLHVRQADVTCVIGSF